VFQLDLEHQLFLEHQLDLEHHQELDLVDLVVLAHLVFQ
jgi:hypothetical protein